MGHGPRILRCLIGWWLELPHVGARGVVHTPQFNGKQEEGVARSTPFNLRCPRNGQADEPSGSASVTQATGRLEQAPGKATEVVSASPDTGQQGDLPQGGLYDPSTVGEGGEGVYLLVFLMKKSFAVRARVVVPALSLVGLACGSVMAQTQEVIISATRAEQPLSEALSSVSVITRQDIEKSQAPSLADLLKGEAGFEFGRNGGLGTTTSFFLRGQESNNLVIMIDGIRSQVDQLGALQTVDVPLHQIERIEILRGNASAMYGDAAVGGVINIFTKQGKGVPRAYGSVSYGAMHTSDVSAGYGGQVNDTKFELNAGRLGTRGMSAMNPNQKAGVNPDKDGYLSENWSARVSQRVDSSLNLTARLSASRSSTDTDNAAVATDTHVFKRKNDTALLSAQKVFNDDWVSSVELSRSSLTYEDLKNGVRYAAGDGSYMNGLMTGQQHALRWFNSYHLGTRALVHFGVDKSSDVFSASGDSAYEMRRENLAEFVGLTSQFDKLSIQLNARHDQVKVDNQQKGVEASNLQKNTGLFGAGYALSPSWKLISSVSTGFRTPTAYELSTTANLQPESYTSKEAGLNYTNDNTRMRTVYFETITKNAVADGPNYSYVNVGEVQSNGLETTLQSAWGRNRLKSSLVFQDPWNVSQQQQLSRRARHYGSIELGRSLTDGYEVGVKVYASGERKNSPYDTQLLSGYALVSFYASKQIDPSLTARVRLENAFDRFYQYAYGYNTPGRGVYATLQYQPK